MRKVCKECTRKSREYERALAVQIIMLAPFAPHLASELWAAFCSVKHHLITSNEINLDKDVFEQKWPEIDMDYTMIMNIYVSISRCSNFNKNIIREIDIKKIE